MPTVLVDTGVWYSLCDHSDSVVSRERIESLYERIKPHPIVLPWPIVYETLRTSFVSKPSALYRFEREIKSPRIAFIDDTPYREDAVDLCFASARRNWRLSLVDCLLRLLLEDVSLRIPYVATFNRRDFNDVCKARRIELWAS